MRDECRLGRSTGSGFHRHVGRRRSGRPRLTQPLHGGRRRALAPFLRLDRSIDGRYVWRDRLRDADHHHADRWAEAVGEPCGWRTVEALRALLNSHDPATISSSSSATTGCVLGPSRTLTEATLDGYGSFSRFWNDPVNGTVYAASDDGLAVAEHRRWGDVVQADDSGHCRFARGALRYHAHCGPSAERRACRSTCSAAPTRAQVGMSFRPCRAPSPARAVPRRVASPCKPIACTPDGIESDGALIAICALESEAFTPATYTAYRLAAGASTWDALGGVPSEGCEIAPNRIIWCTNEQGDTWMTATLPA